MIKTITEERIRYLEILNVSYPFPLKKLVVNKKTALIPKAM